MSLSAATAWEVRTGGSNNNGGGFVTGASGTDYSQQNGAQATLTTASTVHTTTSQVNVAPGDYTVSANDVGNILHITGGTATAGFYQITAADVANKRWTLDRAVGTAGQTVAGAMGGAFADPAIATSAAVNGNTIFIKAGTYSITSTTVNVAGGRMQPAGFGVIAVGYNSSRSFGNGDTAPVLQINVTNGQITAGPATYYNLVCDGNNTSGAIVGPTNSATWIRCVFKNFATAGNTTNALVGCELTANSASVFSSPTSLAYCEIHANTAAQTVSNSDVVGCLVYGNTGATTDGLSIGNAGGRLLHCVFYGNGRDGIRIGVNNNAVGPILQNCHAEGNAGVGYNITGTGVATLVACGSYNNTSGRSSGNVNDLGAITLSGSAFTSAGTGDFSLNNTGSAGAALRAAGRVIPNTNTFLAGLTTAYPDVGAAQHQDGGGGGFTTGYPYVG